MPYRRLPHGSPGGGRYLVTRLTAGVLNREGGMKLPGNATPVVGSINVLARPLDWQPADSITLKSPLSAVAVGNRASDCGGACRLRLSVSCAAAKKFRALREPLRRSSKTLPWN